MVGICVAILKCRGLGVLWSKSVLIGIWMTYCNKLINIEVIKPQTSVKQNKNWNSCLWSNGFYFIVIKKKKKIALDYFLTSDITCFLYLWRDYSQILIRIKERKHSLNILNDHYLCKVNYVYQEFICITHEEEKKKVLVKMLIWMSYLRCPYLHRSTIWFFQFDIPIRNYVTVTWL